MNKVSLLLWFVTTPPDANYMLPLCAEVLPLEFESSKTRTMNKELLRAISQAKEDVNAPRKVTSQNAVKWCPASLQSVL